MTVQVTLTIEVLMAKSISEAISTIREDIENTADMLVVISKPITAVQV